MGTNPPLAHDNHFAMPAPQETATGPHSQKKATLHTGNAKLLYSTITPSITQNPLYSPKGQITRARGLKY